ncbi:signal protein [Kitasatospora sp. NPDC004240]
MRFVRSAVLVAAAVLMVGGCTEGSKPATATTAPTATAAQPAPSGSSSPSAGKAPSPTPTRVALSGLSPAQLQSRWWSWAASIEEARHPVSDPDGRFCAEGQKDGVWLLAGTFGGTVTRNCTLPSDAQVAFPVVNRLGTGEECKAFMDGAEGSAVVDGKTLTLEKFWATPVVVSTEPGNPISDEEESFRTSSCGLWVRVGTLAPGRHEIVFRGSSGGFSVGVDYWLTVTEPAA